MVIDMGEVCWIEVAGIRTCYFQVGSGALVVFLHGGFFGSWDVVCIARDWVPVFQDLVEGFEVLFLDRLG